MTDISLQGAHNVRDVAGMPAGSFTTRAGVLLRGDSLERLTEADVDELVVARGLRQVIDLRSESERNERGRGPIQHRGSTTECLSPSVMSTWPVGTTSATRR